MKRNISVRGRQSESTAAQEVLPLLMVISILVIVFITVFNAV